MDSTNYATICAPYDFSNVESLKSFVNATWYKNTTTANFGGHYSDVLMINTGLTEAQMTSLFDYSVANTFGWYVHDYSGKVAVKYACANTANCTSQELVDKQWGAAGVTKNPIVNEPIYTP